MKLCLGTVQFGMDYGIQGGRKPSKKDVFEILDYAADHGITTLDTACGYGDAESIVGEYNQCTSFQFDIISKLSKDIFLNLPSSDYIDTAERTLEMSLLKLMSPKLKGLLFHNPAYLYDENAVKALMYLKHAGFTEGIGVSVYEPVDAEYALQLGMDIIQLPANLFDRRFDHFLEKVGAVSKVYTRSIYLQGMLLMEIEEISKKLPAAVEYVTKFDELCRSFHYSRREVAMSYMKNKHGVNSILFGVDNLLQLKENIAAYEQKVPDEIIDEISRNFVNINEDIVSPLKWKKLQ
ncbi:MAG: aldo/keto reductase [Herbinix sp.]|nr:aldo/keto reductase [Herbinix sp.]